MDDLEYRDQMWFEQKPNVYGGDNLDEHIPQWWGYAAGDKQDDMTHDHLVFRSEDFPPGTKIIVKEPLCPKCNEVYANCMVRGRDGDCNFDWKSWAEGQYS